MSNKIEQKDGISKDKFTELLYNKVLKLEKELASQKEQSSQNQKTLSQTPIKDNPLEKELQIEISNCDGVAGMHCWTNEYNRRLTGFNKALKFYPDSEPKRFGLAEIDYGSHYALQHGKLNSIIVSFVSYHFTLGFKTYVLLENEVEVKRILDQPLVSQNITTKPIILG